MAREQRIHYETAIYHVIVRGNNRAQVFLNEEEKRKYLQIIADYREKYDFHLYAYVIMDNHAHLLVQVEEVELAKIMQGIQQRYTRYYNQRYGRSGHVFEQRYKAKLCSEDAYLLTLLCYIHQNPVKAGMPEGLHYRWSSHSLYEKGAKGLVETNFILGMINGQKSKAIHEYQRLMGTEVGKAEYGDGPSYQERMNQTSEKIKEVEELPSKTSWTELVEELSLRENISSQQLLEPSRKRERVEIRKQLIVEAILRSDMKRAEIAERLQIDPAVVTRVHKEWLGKSKK